MVAERRVRRALVVSLLALCVAGAWLLPLDERAAQSLDAGTKRAFATFAVARGLNAAISVMQGTEITGGVGVSATFSVGEVLDPVNDVVEQFADLMMFATVAFGIQEVLLAMGGHAVVQVFLLVLVAAWSAWYLAARAPPRWLNGLLILALMARFAIPAAVVGSDATFRYFLADDYRESEAAVRREAVPAAPAAALPDAPLAEEPGWIESLKETWDDARRGVQDLDLRARVEALKARAEGTVEHVVRLIVVFLLQTLVMPLAILWGLYAGMRNVLVSGAGRRRPPDDPGKD